MMRVVSGKVFAYFPLPRRLPRRTQVVLVVVAAANAAMVVVVEVVEVIWRGGLAAHVVSGVVFERKLCLEVRF